MSFKYPIIILSFFILALLQNSFLPYFNIMGVVPNLIFILFFILIFFSVREKVEDNFNQYYDGFFISIFAGFFLDIFSSIYLPDGRQVLGISIIYLLIVYLLVKISMYFLRERQDKYLIFYFLSIFLFSFFIYNIFLNLLSNNFSLALDFNRAIFISFLYNLILAYSGFYIHKFIRQEKNDNQLKLF